MLNLIYLAYAFARSAALWIILFTSTATIALLYSSLPRRSEEGLQSSDANCAACAMADSVSSLPKSASSPGCTQWGRVHIGEPDANGCAIHDFYQASGGPPRRLWHNRPLFFPVCGMHCRFRVGGYRDLYFCQDLVRLQCRLVKAEEKFVDGNGPFAIRALGNNGGV